eukprot:6212534-Pleurochrysis_carterae.AAC.2
MSPAAVPVSCAIVRGSRKCGGSTEYCCAAVSTHPRTIIASRAAGRSVFLVYVDRSSGRPGGRNYAHLLTNTRLQVCFWVASSARAGDPPGGRGPRGHNPPSP